MIVEICFLDQAGKLSCSLAGGFINVDHVTGYVRGALKNVMMQKTVSSAELYSDAFPSPLVITGCTGANGVVQKSRNYQYRLPRPGFTIHV